MYRLSVNPRGTAIPIAGGDRTPIKLVNGVRSSGVFIVARATVVVSVAAATLLKNRGSVWSLFDEVVLDENGTDKMIIRGNVLRFAGEMQAPSALSAVRAGVAVGTYQLEEAAYLSFANPLSLDPLETTFVERDSRQALNLSFRLNANPANKLFTVGPATVVVSNVSVTVEHDYETPTADGITAPIFIPTIRQQIANISGDVTQQAEYIRTPNLIRQVIISQEDSLVGEVQDILRGFALRGDFKPVVGPAIITLNDLVLRGEFSFGGAVVASNRSHVGLNFQRYGQLSECLNPAQDVNLRFEFSALPSVIGGGTATLRLTFFELFRDPAVTAPTVRFPY